MKKRFREEPTIGLLNEVDAGVAVRHLCHRRGFSEAALYL